MSATRTSAFFRQSGWMVIATFVGGAFMALVHTIAGRMGAEYSTFVSLLRLLIVIGIPSVGLQTILARQTAMVKNQADEQQLIATVRGVLGGLFFIWVAFAIAVLCAMKPLSHLLKVSNPVALYYTIALGLIGLPIPVLKGVVQGQHRFGGLGWMQITDGVGRFTFICVIILGLKGKAAGALAAVLVGQIITLTLAAALTRPYWGTRPAVRFDWKRWLAEALPLTAGLGTILIFTSIDMLFVQALFPDPNETSLYSAAMLTGYAIVQFIAPVALVMFARVARSVARQERGDSLGITLVSTISFGCLAAIGCTILPWLPLHAMYPFDHSKWEAAPMVPFFAWALLPVTVSNVLMQNILARGKFRAIPWLMLVPALYATALCLQAPALIHAPTFISAFDRVIVTLGLAGLALCVLAAWFSRPERAASPSDQDSAPEPAISGKPSSPSA